MINKALRKIRSRGTNFRIITITKAYLYIALAFCPCHVDIFPRHKGNCQLHGPEMVEWYKGRQYNSYRPTEQRTWMATQIAKFMGQDGAHLVPVGPRWAPYWPHEPCYHGIYLQPVYFGQIVFFILFRGRPAGRIDQWKYIIIKALRFHKVPPM